ncbi:hypothetical protein AB4Y45_25545 [Paraburkholderia sp. EG287A]|uniref:hypothetical protein n=1 Tax=unclassified Paraburkholderia TaxID=2615204 RepID=UPI0034D21A31
MLTIEERWTNYRLRRIDHGTPPERLQELRTAYYAGFRGMLDATRELSELDEYVARSLLERLHIESRRFGKGIR